MIVINESNVLEQLNITSIKAFIKIKTALTPLLKIKAKIA
jgi:hypothetical protein